MSLQTVVLVQCSGSCGRWLNAFGRPTRSRHNAAVYADYGAAEEAAHVAGWSDGHDGRLAADPAEARLVPLCSACRETL